VNLDDLKTHVWRRLPVRKFVAGRRAIDDLVELAVANWDHKMLDLCVNDEQRAIVSRTISDSMKRGHQVVSGKEVQEYGFVWVIVLGALANLIVQIVLQWWMERRANRVLLMAWQSEMLG
jgi:hypothetical protein